MDLLVALAPASDLVVREDQGRIAGLFQDLWHLLTHTTGAEWVFGLFAAMAVFSAIATVTRKNVVVAAVWLVMSFASVAVCYVLLDATFLAAIQVLVYAGAMMVLFVFVIMVLDVDERGRETHRKPSRIGRIGYYGLFGLLTLFVVWVLVGTMSRQYVAPPAEITDPDFGTADGLGRELFTEYLFAFEAVSLLLLAAVVGAVVVARSRRERIKEAQAAGLTGAALHAAGLTPTEDLSTRPSGAEGAQEDLTEAEIRRPNPVMDFGAPSAGGHDGGT
jgi:NADH-quinone oxidoreductase subunit J